MRDFYTYLHKKPDGSVFYVGKGVEGRAFSHDNRNIHWHRTVAKYGFEVQILAYFQSEDEAFRQERLLIKSFRDSGIKLVNMTDGGEGSSGYKWTDEQKSRWIDAVGKNPMQGKKHSDETKAKISAKAIGRKVSDSAKARISEKMKARVFSDTHRQRLSAATKGGGNPSAKKCVVHGVKYDCAQDAATALGLSKTTVSRKCKRGTNSNFQYI